MYQKPQIILGEITVSQNHPNRGSSPSTPRWVKVFVIIFIILIVLVIILHLMGFEFGNHASATLISYTSFIEKVVQ